MYSELGSVTCIKNDLFNEHKGICNTHILSYTKTDFLSDIIAEHVLICENYGRKIFEWISVYPSTSTFHETTQGSTHGEFNYKSYLYVYEFCMTC